MKFFRSRRVVLAGLTLLALFLFFVRPRVGRLRIKIANSLSLALGRQVEISSASFRLLPQPGFDLRNFVIHDDPAFSAEPLLRSGEVTAYLRITSLMRGQLEIARLNLTEPSMNLVRDSEGHWNLEYLLDRAAKIAVAPTGKPKGEFRRAFPYIESSRGRINFKFGLEKKRYALTEADFSLFQDSENSWGIRLEAKPMRTDFNLSDTGLLRVNGSWERAQTLRETPLHFSMRWEGIQLGQGTKLIYGIDKGWRGTVILSGQVSGAPGDLAVTAAATVTDFRRYDILNGESLQLRTQCNGKYSSTTSIFSGIECQSRIGDGYLNLRGDATGPITAAVYHLAVTADRVPVQALVTLAQHAKKDLPADLMADGTFNGEVKLHREGTGQISRSGEGETSALHLRSQSSSSQVSVDKIRFDISNATVRRDVISKKLHAASLVSFNPSVPDGSNETRINVEPFTITLGKTGPTTVGGWFSRRGYDLSVQGGGSVQRFFQTARLLGIPVFHSAADGNATVNLRIADNWAGFSPPRVTGTAELHSVRAIVSGLNLPLQIESADIVLNHDDIAVQNLSASIGSNTWHGSLTLPRPCASVDTCPAQFDLHTDEVATDDLDKSLNPRYGRQLWYRLLMGSNAAASLVLSLRANGQLASDRLTIGAITASQVSADVKLDHGKLEVTNLRGKVLGGSHVGDWTADFTARPPAYTGSGIIRRMELEQVATAMRDNWISGRANVSYRGSTFGSSGAELLSSASAKFQFDASETVLPHIFLSSSADALRAAHFNGNLMFQHGELNFQEARMECAAGTYQVSGTASLGRTLHLTFSRSGAPSLKIGGTLNEPIVVVSPIAEANPPTQVALKP